ncbi:hypothetical protein BDZ97DRAFT_1916095 [Flammula alnicola]|nr:hypothetical protein BDZ97DRAFT_1916095 [Flammula alnicola]
MSTSDTGALKYNGFEAWLEDGDGFVIKLPKTRQINEKKNTISAVVHLKPKTVYSVRWTRGAGLSPMSALCELYIQGGYREVPGDPKDFRVARLTMDKAKRGTQSRTSKGWLNPPYRRYGCLRMSELERKRHDARFRDSDASLGCVRLEIRRVRGQLIESAKWIMDDQNQEKCVIDNFDNLDVIDDPDEDIPPYVTFIFHFRDYVAGTKRDPSPRAQGSLRTKGSVIRSNPVSARDPKQRTDVKPESPDPDSDDDVDLLSRLIKHFNDHKSSSSDSEEVDELVEETPVPSQKSKQRTMAPEGSHRTTASTEAGPSTSTSRMSLKRKARGWDADERSANGTKPANVSTSHVTPIKRQPDEIRLPNKSPIIIDLTGDSHSVSRAATPIKNEPDDIIDLTADYEAIDALEKALAAKLKAKLESKQQKIKEMQRLLANAD